MDSPPASPAVQCAECGAELPVRAKFCLECGTPVTAVAERESRRTVTLLFTDVTGSTAMGEHLDPETYRGVMGRYFAVARAAVERHGGRVEKFVGDAVLAVFGLPEVREDDALRAVRAAYELNSAVSELSNRLEGELGVRLQIRTGVNTGAVVTGSPRAGGSFATGDAVNTAARLEQAAGPGQVLIGATTHDLVRDAVETEPVEPVQAKGKAEPVPAYRLLSLLDRDRGRRRREDAPLIGRERESRALDEALERMLATGRSHLITVIGPAGIGKSRLLTEFVRRVGDRAAVASGRCVSYGQGITYWPLVQALRDALALSGTESDELVTHALEQAMGGAADTDRVIEPLIALLGRSGTAPSSETTVWAVRRLLEELATARPLVLTIDDLHWAEPTLLELIERVRDDVADLPLLLVCQARPELVEQNPGWGSGALNALTFVLDPLDADHISTSLSSLLDGEPPAALAPVVADWSGGNPLFVEEIVAHLVESGALSRGQDGWSLTGDLDRTAMPPTVSALLSSRLGNLPAPERDLLERLSIIGLEFTPADAALLAGSDDLGSRLASLARRDLLRRVRTSRGEIWAFKHIMVRDAAYDSLAKVLRAELHERFADGIAADQEMGLERDSFVAHHLAQAATYRRELGERSPRVEALVERAIDALLVAAQTALDVEAFDASEALLDQADELRSASSITRRRVLVRKFILYFHTIAVTAGDDVVERLAAEQDETATALDDALLECMRAEVELSSSKDIDPARLVQLGERVAGLATEEGQNWLRVIGLRAQCSAHTMLGQWVRAAAVATEILRIGNAADVRGANMVIGAVGLYGPGPLSESARFMRARNTPGVNPRMDFRLQQVAAVGAAAEASEDAAQLVQALQERADGLVREGALTDGELFILIDAHSLVRDLDAAIALAIRVNAEFLRHGDYGHASTYVLFQAALMLERGDPLEEIVPLIDEAEGYTSQYDALSVAYLAATRSIVAARTGDTARGAALAEEALRVVDRTDQAWQRADLRRLVSEALGAHGQTARVREVLEQALALYHGKGIVAYDADVEALIERLT